MFQADPFASNVGDGRSSGAAVASSGPSFFPTGGASPGHGLVSGGFGHGLPLPVGGGGGQEPRLPGFIAPTSAYAQASQQQQNSQQQRAAPSASGQEAPALPLVAEGGAGDGGGGDEEEDDEQEHAVPLDNESEGALPDLHAFEGGSRDAAIERMMAALVTNNATMSAAVTALVEESRHSKSTREKDVKLPPTAVITNLKHECDAATFEKWLTDLRMQLPFHLLSRRARRTRTSVRSRTSSA